MLIIRTADNRRGVRDNDIEIISVWGFPGNAP
jgi:hypothetical protein